TAMNGMPAFLSSTYVWATVAGTGFSVMSTLEKSRVPKIPAMIGMMRSFTRESTIFPNAAPMITPTARSITLPLTANSRNSEARLIVVSFFSVGPCLSYLGRVHALAFCPSSCGPCGFLCSPCGRREKQHGADRLQRPAGAQRLPADRPRAGRALDRLHRPPRRQDAQPIDGRGRG